MAGGVECCDLTAHTVARRIQTSGQLYHEKIFFVKHFDTHALTDFPKEKMILKEYTRVLYHVLFTGLSKWDKEGILGQFRQGKLLQNVLKSLKIENATEDEVNRWLNDQKAPLLYALNDAFETKYYKNDYTIEEFEEQIRNKLKALKSSFEKDFFWNSVMNQDRIFKTVQDICIENSAGHNSKCLCLELFSVEQLKLAREAVSSHPLLELDWFVAGPEVKFFKIRFAW